MSNKMYEAKTEFRSHTLSKQFYPGELINEHSFNMLNDSEKNNFSGHTPAVAEETFEVNLPNPEIPVGTEVTLTNNDLENNPDLVNAGLKEGDVVEVVETIPAGPGNPKPLPSSPVNESLVAPALEEAEAQPEAAKDIEAPAEPEASSNV